MYTIGITINTIGLLSNHFSLKKSAGMVVTVTETIFFWVDLGAGCVNGDPS